MDLIPLPILWNVREYLRQKRDQLTELNEVKKTQVKIQFLKSTICLNEGLTLMMRGEN